MKPKDIFQLTLAFALFAMILIFASTESYAQPENSKRIMIENNEFRVDGRRIWINGANTPWNKWNDFGGGYDDMWWDRHFKALHENGVNAVRVWINCNNDNGAILNDDAGMVSEVSDAHWADLDKFFATAERNNILISNRESINRHPR